MSRITELVKNKLWYVIKIIQRGDYTTIRVLDKKTQVYLQNEHSSLQKTVYIIDTSLKLDKIPHKGKYREYQVMKEADFSNGIHVELLLERCQWQGYLLSRKLQDKQTKDFSLTPIKELITQCSCVSDCDS